MKVVGMYRELETDGVNLPSILTARGLLPQEDQALVLQYLGQAPCLFTWMGGVFDPFEPQKRRFLSGAASVYGDTEWIWREDLTYFVERYRIGLPVEFVARVRRNAGRFLATDAQLREAYQETLDTYTLALTDEAYRGAHPSPRQD